LSSLSIILKLLSLKQHLKSTMRFMLYTTALLASAAQLAQASDFAGTYTRTSVSPNVCASDPTDCTYQCTASYEITVFEATATMYPTANPSGCSCVVVTATIAGDSAQGSITGAQYSLSLTSAGINLALSTSDVVCTGTYAKETTATTGNSNNGNILTGAGILSLAMMAMAVFY
jgi:hypothetical protein